MMAFGRKQPQRSNRLNQWAAIVATQSIIVVGKAHILLFDPEYPSVPTLRSHGAIARSGRQDRPLYCGRRRLGLDGREHGGTVERVGLQGRRCKNVSYKPPLPPAPSGGRLRKADHGPSFW